MKRRQYIIQKRFASLILHYTAPSSDLSLLQALTWPSLQDDPGIIHYLLLPDSSLFAFLFLFLLKFRQIALWI
jgi:hypothetical protein